MRLDSTITLNSLRQPLAQLWETAARSVQTLDRTYGQEQVTPVFTVNGKYVPQGWTEWTQGFQFGCGLLVFDAVNDLECLRIGRQGTLHRMAAHVSHEGVHDHGFNNVSTYGHLRRLSLQGRIDADLDLIPFCEMALRVSGAVQAARWSRTSDGNGFIYSFNGPHSLFADTMRSLRVLALAHQLGHLLWSENDVRISLMDRLLQHALTTVRYNVYYGAGRDVYDVPGRVAHESIFNPKDGNYRCPSSQQGYSPFSTWTRGLAWVILGLAEQLEFLDSGHGISEIDSDVVTQLVRAARVTSDYYLLQSARDGIPFWDTGAPGLASLPNYRDEDSDPFNAHEPVDSSAAAIAAQGFLRLGAYLARQGDGEGADRYQRAGWQIARTLLAEPYLNRDPHHQGILLHTVYHRPRGWDAIPAGRQVPCGESALWGDYHLLELGLYLQRQLDAGPYYVFYDMPSARPKGLPAAARSNPE